MTSLVLRRTDSPHIREWDRDKFWSVFSGGVRIGVIVENRGRSDEPPDWQWTMHLHAGPFGNGVRPTEGAAPTRETAMLAFRAAWDIVRPRIGDEGWALHVEHQAWSQAQSARWRRQREGTEPGGY